jgi:cytochrome P450
MLAGHETTSNTVGWILYELARQPDIQKNLRQEIRNMKEAIRTRGQTEVTMRDLDAMPYLLAVVKVSQSRQLDSK